MMCQKSIIDSDDGNLIERGEFDERTIFAHGYGGSHKPWQMKHGASGLWESILKL